jgi:hypothetical protein
VEGSASARWRVRVLLASSCAPKDSTAAGHEKRPARYSKRCLLTGHAMAIHGTLLPVLQWRVSPNSMHYNSCLLAALAVLVLPASGQCCRQVSAVLQVDVMRQHYHSMASNEPVVSLQADSVTRPVARATLAGCAQLRMCTMLIGLS